MGEVPAEIEGLIAARRLERVEVNTAHAISVIQTARRHVRTAVLLSGTEDHAMAFTAAYDGARKALAAVLAVKGLRVRAVGGAHRNTCIAAAAFVTDDALRDFEWMRQVRNSTEYPDDDRPTATSQDVEEAINAADAIVTACAHYVEGRPSVSAAADR